ncbi:unnamed protein product [Pieris brassicae]|uniref:Uncharacterized protein n=1 Tax=Pieris brassicae TaxID=7116 RepID=A0A9P0WUU3_PIEBR|nr:unnamed protein product [Pieris brassicae]
MCRKHLPKVKQLLTSFEREPKEIRGREIKVWFLTGEEIFKTLFLVGQSVEWRYTKIKDHSDVSEICSKVTANKVWLESFISVYPNFRINFDLTCSADDICKVRSGIDVLIKGFSGISPQFDKVLENINEEEVHEFDRCLKIWVETGHRPDFRNKPSGLLQDHWWWF